MEPLQKRRLWRAPGAVVALLAALGAGCSGGAGRSKPVVEADAPAPQVVSVAAASDLQTALPELIRAFEKESPLYRVQPTFGASGQLAEQIKAGARFDLFLSANEQYLNELALAREVNADSIRPYAVGALVLAARKDAPVKPGSLADVTRPEVKKLAIANPAVAPYGAAAKQALTSAGLWDKVADKIVIVESVRQALQVVETGDADLGLVGKATADAPGVVSVDVDPKLYEPIVQALGVVSTSDHSDGAEGFARFVRGAKGQAVLARFGFKPPPGGDGPGPPGP